MTFSEIKRRSDKPHYPLWKLRVTDDEYEQLKSELRKVYNQTSSFDNVQDEAMLYMAEWYRREYNCDEPSRKAVFHDLGTNYKDDEQQRGKQLLEAAKSAAMLINKTMPNTIEFVKGEKNMAWFYSLLYQGGLPLRKIINNYNVWRKAIRNMVWEGYDFTDTGLPLTAAKSDSIRSFCDRVVEAALMRQYSAMPFYCENEQDQTYRFLTEEINKVERDRYVRIPFDIQWKFIIDEPAQRIAINYAIDAPQRLQEDFIERHQLNDTVSFRIRVGDRIIPGPEYKKARSFSPFHCPHSYDGVSEISILATENKKIICEDSLDLSEPHVIHKELGSDFYRLGNKSNCSDVRLLFTQDWRCLTNHIVNVYNYLDNDKLFVLSIGNEDVVLQNTITKEEKRFSAKTPLFWTEFDNNAPQNQYVQTTLFQTSSMNFYRCSEELDRVERRRIDYPNVSFWNYNTQTWDNNPLIGKIKARVPDGKGGFATSKMFLNTGTPIKMRIISCTETTCTVRFDWESGTITCHQGRPVQNGDMTIWTFGKEQLLSDEKSPSDEINCICTPKGACKQSFSIKVHIPFRGFYIYDSEGLRVPSLSLIPYSDFNVYRYSLNDEDVTINIEGTNIRVKNNTSGYLKDVLERDGSISIQSLLDKNAQSVDWAEVKLSVVRSGRTQEKYVIKEYPYHFKRINDSILVRENNKYMGDIWIIPFDRNQQYIVLHNEAGQYTLPENLEKLGKVLLISPQQRVFPKLENLSEATGLSREQRDLIKDEARNKISEELKSAKIDSDIWQRCLYWYNIWYNNDDSVIFPWNNVFEYKYIAKSANALVELVLVLWLNCNDDSERDNLMNNLLDHERDLALQWFWLPQFSVQECFFDVSDDIKQKQLLKWVFSQGIPMDDLFNNTIDVLMGALIKFNCFWNILRKQSLLKGNWMEKNGAVVEDMIDVLLENAQMKKPPIEIDEDALLRDITKDDNVPQIDEQIENALISFTQKREKDGQWYPENAIKFGKRVQLLINHRNNAVDLLKCNLRLRSTVLYYFTKYPQDFVYFLYKYRNAPIETDNTCLLYDDNQ